MTDEASRAETIPVWDIVVRVFHWTLVAGFAIAYLSEGEPLWLHIWAGYVVAAVVILRILWGFVGPQHARFSDFVFPLGRVLSHLLDELRFRAKRYIGHSPAGGAMIVLLLVVLLLTTASGAALLTREKGMGPFSTFITVAQQAPRQGSGKEHEADSSWKEIHEVFANLALVFVLVHIGGVALASLSHHENLVASMLNGRKRAS